MAQIRAERGESAEQPVSEAKEKQVNREIMLQRPADGTPPKLPGGYRAVLNHTVIRAGVHRESRDRAPPRKINELAAGEGHAVDLVQAIRKECDAAVHSATPSPVEKAFRRRRRTR